jgi:protein involved in polysaccharide export with SLBB domain
MTDRRGWGWLRWTLGLLALAAGCAHRDLDRALLADHTPAAHRGDLAAFYAVHCPDVLAVRLGDADPWQGECPVGPDGRIDLGPSGTPRVEGLTAPEIAARLARSLRLPPEQVQVRVARYESQQLFVHGEVSGLQRAVPYVGPETILDLLQRLGGLTPGAAPGDLQVVRPHVADGKAPEVFTIDLAAIVLHKDQQSNLRLEPFDQVYIGQSGTSSLSGALPPVLRPVFDTLFGLRSARPAPSNPSSQEGKTR